MNRDSLERLLTGCPSLTELTLEHTEHMHGDDYLRLLADQCGSRLRVLRLPCGGEFSDSGMQQLLMSCLKLTDA